MTDETQQVAPPAPPANAAEASARLATLTNDKAWGDKLLASDPAATKKFKILTAMVAEGGDHVDRALSGALPDVPDSDLKTMAGTADMLRTLGIKPDVVRQTLEKPRSHASRVRRHEGMAGAHHERSILGQGVP
jgi:hypothetical protein